MFNAAGPLPLDFIRPVKPRSGPVLPLREFP